MLVSFLKDHLHNYIMIVTQQAEKAEFRIAKLQKVKSDGPRKDASSLDDRGKVKARILSQLKSGEAKLEKQRNFECFTIDIKSALKTSTTHYIDPEPMETDISDKYELVDQGVLRIPVLLSQVFLFNDVGATNIFTLDESRK